MESNTSVLQFYILPFFINNGNALFVFSSVFFFLIYLVGMLVNSLIITVICLDPHLHTPMYLFLCNLSTTDICYTTVIVPKLLSILLSGNNAVSITQCLIQIIFFFLAASSENVILFIMGYDRYVAICHPLHYHRLLSNKLCMFLMVVTWISGGMNSSLFTSSISRMFFCSSSTIHQFFCEPKALLNIACSGTEMFYIVMYADILILGVIPFLCNLISYVKIVSGILRIKSKGGRRKAFSTCSSHLTVMTIYYGSAVCAYMTPPSDRRDLLEETLTVFYTTVVPMLNPLIYSLRNNEIKNSLMKMLGCHSNIYYE